MNNYEMDLALECLDNLCEIRRATDNGHILNLIEIAIRAVDKVIIGIEDDLCADFNRRKLRIVK